MSRAAKLTLAGTSAMAASIVLFVHYTQRAEKAVRPVPSHPMPMSMSMSMPTYTPTYKHTHEALPTNHKLTLEPALAASTKSSWRQAMHEGVVRDLEQQRLKRERQADFEMQRQLEAEYRQVQSVSDGRSAVTGSTSTAGGGSTAAAEAAMEGGR